MTIITNKKVVAILLLILLLIFVYIGYYGTNEATEKNVGKIEEQLEVPDTTDKVTSGQMNIKINEIPQEVKYQNNQTDEDFFIEYRLDRDRTRSRQIELLQSIIYNTNSSANERQEAQKKILAITTTLEQELKLESIIKAKGFQDAILFIQPSSVIVIVQSKEFGPSQATKLGDLVAKTTGHTLEQITIIPKV